MRDKDYAAKDITVQLLAGEVALVAKLNTTPPLDAVEYYQLKDRVDNTYVEQYGHLTCVALYDPQVGATVIYIVAQWGGNAHEQFGDLLKQVVLQEYHVTVNRVFMPLSAQIDLLRILATAMS